MNFADLLDFFFPSACVACGAHLARGEALCAPCEAAVPLHATLFCAVCGARVPPGIFYACHRSAGYRFGAATDFSHETVRTLVHVLKFKNVRRAAGPLGRMTARYLSALGLDLRTFTITAVPLGASRMRTRGYNQAALIAEQVAREMGLPFRADLLRRARATKPQTECADRTERRSNIADAFAPARPDAAQGLSLILIDDVRTSGATMDSAVRALKAAGAKHIIALTAARVG